MKNWLYEKKYNEIKTVNEERKKKKSLPYYCVVDSMMYFKMQLWWAINESYVNLAIHWTDLYSWRAKNKEK